MRFLLLIGLIWLTVSRAGETVTIVAEDNWYPYAGVVDKKPHGIAVDIVKAAYQAVGVQALFKSMPYARCLREVKDGVELGCFDSLKDPKLAPLYLFHDEPLFFAEISIYAQKPSPTFLRPIDLIGARVSLTNGYTYGTEIETTFNIDRDVANSDLFNLRKTVAGRTDYSLVYTRVFEYLAGSDFEIRQLHRVGRVTRDPLYISFSLKHAQAKWAAAKLDDGLRKIRESGEYARIEGEWEKRLRGGK